MPDKIWEWGSAGIVDPRDSVIRDAGNGCNIGIPNPLLWNSATGRGHASMGCGFPGACVEEHNGNQNTSKNNGEAPQGVELDAAETLHGASERRPDILQGIPGGTEPQSDHENLWEVAVWEDINTTHWGDRVLIAAVDRQRRTRMQDKLRDQQCASRW